MNEQVLCDTIQGNEEDVNIAVAAAKEAQVKWASLAPHVRARHLYAIARAVQKHSRLIAVVEALDNGKVCSLSLALNGFSSIRTTDLITRG